MTILLWAARVFVAGLFLYAGGIKAGASEGFAITISQFSILPAPLITIAAILLPFAEIVGAILLLIPRTTRMGAALLSALLVVFLTALTWALSQGLIVDCGCFGDEPPSRDRMVATILRDVVLLAITLPLAAVRRPGPKPNNRDSGQKIPASGGPR